MSEEELLAAHKKSIYHRDEILASGVCGCFYCLRRFAPTEIVEWVDKGTTALCQYCGIDSVIGSASGWAINEAFLREMHQFWFAFSSRGSAETSRFPRT